MIDAAVVDRLIDSIISEDGGTALNRCAESCPCEHCQIARDLIESKVYTVVTRNIAEAIIIESALCHEDDEESVTEDLVYSAIGTGFALGMAYAQSQQLEAIHGKD